MGNCPCEIKLTVKEPDAVKLSYVEAEIKPDQTKDVVPAETPQTVEPDPGFTLGAVNVDAIPPEYIKPAGKTTFTENENDADISQFALADVAVPPPTLQQKTATPTKQQQELTPDAGYDGLSSAVVEPIPDEYIVPSGTLNITENANGINVTDKATVNVAVPVPVMPEEYCMGGSLADNTVTGYYYKRGITAINNRFLPANTNTFLWADIPDSVESIIDRCFMQCGAMRLVGDKLPQNLKTIRSFAFYYCYALQLTEIPDSVETLQNNCFQSCVKIQISKLPSKVTVYPANCFMGCGKITINKIPSVVTEIGNYAFDGCAGITALTFDGTPSSISATAFRNCYKILNIYVPWSEGAVANAPWGATNATITYDYTGG